MEELLTIEDLMARWGLSRQEAIDRVKKQGVPYIPHRPEDMHTNWRKARFLPSAVARWEADNQRAYGTGEKPEAEPRPSIPPGQRRLPAWNVRRG